MEMTNISKNNEENMYLPLELNYLSESLAKLYNNSEFSDIDIEIEDNLIKAHKIILANRNKVFKEMIIHTTLETKSNVLTIKDIDFEAVEAFVKYLYCGKIMKKNMTTTLLSLVHKFEDQLIKSNCEEYLCRNININNSVENLLAAIETNAESLKLEAARLIVRNYSEIKHTKDFHRIRSNSEAYDVVLSQFSTMVSCDKFFTIIRKFPTIICKFSTILTTPESNSTNELLYQLLPGKKEKLPNLYDGELIEKYTPWMMTIWVSDQKMFLKISYENSLPIFADFWITVVPYYKKVEFEQLQLVNVLFDETHNNHIIKIFDISLINFSISKNKKNNINHDFSIEITYRTYNV